MICKNYLKGWFLIDLIAIFPMDYIIEQQENDLNQFVRITRIGKLYKLIKITRLVRLVKVIKQ